MEQKKIKVIIADDHPLLSAGLKLMLDDWQEFDVVGTAKNGVEACELCEKLSPDIVIMDLYMPEMSGTEAIGRIKVKCANIKILALTTFDDEETVKKTMAAGCDGFLLKAVEPDTLKKSLLSIMDGFGVFDETATRKIREMAGHREQFTEREKELLRMICDGLTNGEIAEKLGLRTGTVKNLISLLLSKTNAVSRSKLASYAIEKHII